jgi:hypothetical protein
MVPISTQSPRFTFFAALVFGRCVMFLLSVRIDFAILAPPRAYLVRHACPKPASRVFLHADDYLTPDPVYRLNVDGPIGVETNIPD